MSIPVYILKRILLALPIVLAVSIIGFLLMRYDFTLGPLDVPAGISPEGRVQTVRVLDPIRLKNPIDPLALLRQNPMISPAALEHEKRRLGLDRSLPEQFGLWLKHVLQFNPQALLSGNWTGFYTPDFGKNFRGEDVSALLIDRAKNTALVNVVSMLITWLIALPLGIYAALHWRSATDRFLTLFSAVGMAMPSFVLALILALVVVKTGILPFGGITSDHFDTLPLPGKILDIAAHIALPVLVLTVIGIAGLQRQMRGNLLEVLGAEYVRTARAKGLPEHKVIYKHAVRTAINPMVTMMGFEFAALLSGSVLIETVLNYPGLGYLTYKAVLETDTNLTMAALVLSSVMLILGNLLADILLKVVDPRIELE